MRNNSENSLFYSQVERFLPINRTQEENRFIESLERRWNDVPLLHESEIISVLSGSSLRGKPYLYSDISPSHMSEEEARLESHDIGNIGWQIKADLQKQSQTMKRIIASDRLAKLCVEARNTVCRPQVPEERRKRYIAALYIAAEKQRNMLDATLERPGETLLWEYQNIIDRTLLRPVLIGTYDLRHSLLKFIENVGETAFDKISRRKVEWQGIDALPPCLVRADLGILLGSWRNLIRDSATHGESDMKSTIPVWVSIKKEQGHAVLQFANKGSLTREQWKKIGKEHYTRQGDDEVHGYGKISVSSDHRRLFEGLQFPDRRISHIMNSQWNPVDIHGAPGVSWSMPYVLDRAS